MAQPCASFGTWEGRRSQVLTCDLVCLYRLQSTSTSTKTGEAWISITASASHPALSVPLLHTFFALHLFLQQFLSSTNRSLLVSKKLLFVKQLEFRSLTYVNVDAHGLPASYYNGHLHYRSLRKAEPISAPLGRHSPLQLEK